MHRFLIASVVGAAGMWFVNSDLPFIGGVVAPGGLLFELLFYLLQGVVMVIVFKMIAGMLSGPGWGRGLLYGIVIYGISSFVWMSQAGMTGALSLEATPEMRGIAISFKDIFTVKGAIGWMLTGTLVGAILDDKAKPAA